jgi:hypothetical protein
MNAVDVIFIGASNELGQFESGLTAQWFGAVRAVGFGLPGRTRRDSIVGLVFS